MNRREFLATAVAASLGGCSLGSAETLLKIQIFNVTEQEQTLLLTIRSEEETEVFSQYMELGARTPEDLPRIETVVSLDGVSRGERLEVEAELPRMVVPTSTYKIIDCKGETISGEEALGELVTVRIYEDSVRLGGDSGANRCFLSGVSTLSETND
jgi:hypothetical protein